MKKGISLIVLVITIVIIIILAGAVILNLASSNPMAKASAAAVLSEQSDLNDAITMYTASIMIQEQDAIYYNVASGATQVSSSALDANDVEIGEGYYNLSDITASCGTAFSSTTFPGSASALLSAVGIKNARYANSDTWTVVMNESGNIKIVKTSSLS